MTIRLRQLEAFSAVARYGGVTAAADALGVSQPAISRLIASLSTSLGFPAFERRDGRLVPTREARYLLGEVDRVLAGVERIEELMGDLSERKGGYLRIACLPGFATSLLPRVLAEFLADRPGVTVTVEPDRPDRILEWIIGQQFDWGIADGFVGHPDVENRLIDMRVVCILPPGHALAARSEIWPEDLAQERMIHTRRDSVFYRELEKTFLARDVRIPSLVEIRQFTGACMLVAQGAGVSVVSEVDAREHEDRGFVIRPYGPELGHRLSLIRPTGAPPSFLAAESMAAFLESLAPYRMDLAI